VATPLDERVATRIIPALTPRITTPMEAERLNQLESLIDDLRRRVEELRGYL
jgi:hypothetical protein